VTALNVVIEGLGQTEIAVQTAGPADGSVVLLIHGSGPGASAAGAWRATLPFLAEHFRVIAPDLLGFGGTAPAPDGRHDRERWLAQLLAVLDSLEDPLVQVVGSSLGGGLALHLALRRPDRIGRLALIAPLGSSFSITPGLERVWGYQPSLPAMDALMHTFVHDAAGISDDIVQLRYENSLVAQDVYSRMFPDPRQRWIDDYVVTAEQVAQLATPTLIVHGREDQVVPFTSSFNLFQTLPNSRLLGIANCGHWAQIEYADEVNSALHAFFA